MDNLESWCIHFVISLSKVFQPTVEHQIPKNQSGKQPVLPSRGIAVYYSICTVLDPTIPNYDPIIALTSQTSTRSSHPQLAHHPSAPNKHQSTPMTNSVCLPIRPNSLPPPSAIGSGTPSFATPNALPSVHTRHVIS